MVGRSTKSHNLVIHTVDRKQIPMVRAGLNPMAQVVVKAMAQVVVRAIAPAVVRATVPVAEILMAKVAARTQ